MSRSHVVSSVAALLLAAAGVAGTPAGVRTCAALTGLRLSDTTITAAEEVAGPAFAPPDGPEIMDLPPFCRIAAVTKPAITFEVWLPLSSWNGKFQGVGNGGMAGTIGYGSMAAALRRGYATAGTDTGHVAQGSFDASWALGRPDLIADFGHRGLHLTTVNGKAITKAFYGKRPAHAYYVGCSKGGQQGLMEAQRYPDDYDGIIAGDPANNWTRFYAGAHLWYSLATTKDPASYIPASHVPLLTDAVNAACDDLDGVHDGVLNDPRACRFDPAVLTCQPGQDPETCFTAAQVKAVKDIWAGARTSAGELVYPGLAPGGEAGPGGWAAWVTGTAPSEGTHSRAADGFFKYMVFDDPDWDFRTFNYDTDVALAVRKVGPLLDAVDPNLERFRRHRAKLIVYHGWSDPDISPLNTIAYYESVAAAKQGKRTRDEALKNTQEFFRLFMVPGMQHCSGGPGASAFDMVSELETWVEKGVAPERVMASHSTNGVVDRTRPLCVYPKAAVYTGAGSTDDAANFECRTPGAGASR
ncbi:MAG: tannase/feruloyl esterase family alpha/beta hydrolase [Acidobacteriota bacterium]